MMDGDFWKKRVDPNLPWDRPAGVWRDIIYIHVYIYTSSRTYSCAHLCSQKKEKRTPSVQARKFEISPNFFYIYSVSKLRAPRPPFVCIRACTGKKVEEWGGRRAGYTVAFSTLQPMQQWRLGIELGTMCRWRVYIAAQRVRERLWEARRVHRRPCNLVIDQFVTIWHFVCTGPVNCVYPGHDDRRVNQVCLGTKPPPPVRMCPFDTKECCPCPFFHPAPVFSLSVLSLFSSQMLRVTRGKDLLIISIIGEINLVVTEIRDENNFSQFLE